MAENGGPPDRHVRISTATVIGAVTLIVGAVATYQLREMEGLRRALSEHMALEGHPGALQHATQNETNIVSLQHSDADLHRRIDQWIDVLLKQHIATQRRITMLDERLSRIEGAQHACTMRR